MCPFLSVVMLFCAAFSSLGVGVIGESSGGKETRANRKHEICRHWVSFLAVKRAKAVNTSQMMKPDTRFPQENGTTDELPKD